ncbi:c-type cytochrome [Candidatus Thioglobus sp.]|uniref:c-type cytochrome n=1 Tax=Candidatus Thioglobus sp. TaxID=2026721 RepID=UPI003D0B0C59
MLINRKYWMFALACLSLNFAIAQTHQGDAKIGQSKIIACTGCHGADGNSIVPHFPSLAGQDAQYLTKQLQDFKGKDRPSALMGGVASGISTINAAHIGAYYAVQNKTPINKDKTKADLLILGKKLYENGNPKTGQAACFTCHGKDGTPLPNLAIPILKNQSPLYMIATLKEFKNKKRINDRERAMSRIIATMSDEQIEAVSYYSSYLTTDL